MSVPKLKARSVDAEFHRGRKCAPEAFSRRVSVGLVLTNDSENNPINHERKKHENTGPELLPGEIWEEASHERHPFFSCFPA